MEVGWIEAGGLFVAGVGVLLGGLRWLTSRMDRIQDLSGDRSDEIVKQFERDIEALNKKFEAENNALKGTINSQGEQIEFLQSELHRYIRHIGILEGVLKSHSIEIPAIELARSPRGSGL